jgi:hypothetical protein
MGRLNGVTRHLRGRHPGLGDVDPPWLGGDGPTTSQLADRS